jgi:DNA-binding NarL/FixJ family response regulator
MIRILVVDDHPVVRDGLCGMFTGDPRFEVVGEAGDGAEAVAMAEALRPDVVLMDLRMPRVDGATAITRMAERGIEAKVLVLTTYETDRDVLPAIKAGATGYLLKDATQQELFRAVGAAARGESVLSPSVASRLLGQVRAPVAEPLTQRELEVLQLVARGTTNREAARRLFISEASVKAHLLHVYTKLGVNDRAAAVAAAYERGLLTPGGRLLGVRWSSRIAGMAPASRSRSRGQPSSTTTPSSPRSRIGSAVADPSRPGWVESATRPRRGAGRARRAGSGPRLRATSQRAPAAVRR